MKKNSNLQEEVEALKNKSHSRAESKGDSDEINDLKREIMRLKEENEKRFQNSDQYLRMKNMMLSKSEKIRDLKYELFFVFIEFSLYEFKYFTFHFILDGDLKDMNQMLLKMKMINRLISHTMNYNYIHIRYKI